MRRHVADDNPTSVVFDRSREDLRSRSRHAIADNDQRLVKGTFNIVAVGFDFAAWFFDLDNRALIDEQAGDFNRFAQGSTAVVAKVDHDAFNSALSAEVDEDFLEIARGALEIFESFFRTIKVAIERRDVDDTDSRFATEPISSLDDFTFYGRLGEFNLPADHFVDD